MAKKRVVITGLGVVSCFGNEVDEYHKKLLAGTSGIHTIEGFDVSPYATRFGGEIRDFSAEGYMDKKQARRADNYVSFTMVAGKKALEQSGGVEEILKHAAPERCGILIGSGMGGMETFRKGVEQFLAQKKRLSPFFVPYIIPNMGGAALAMDTGFMGPNYSISTACATGSHCIISAADHIRHGHADVMLAGGAEHGINPVGLVGFIGCRALSERNDEPGRASRPWDKGRDGFVLGEGAGVLVLMSHEKALEMGVPILAEYVGGGISCDAHHMTEPRQDGKGIAASINNALQDGEVTQDQINFINAHATSTPAGDMAEINAILKVIKDPSKVTINATKSMIGHGLGAAAALEAVAITKAVETGDIHPTINLDDPEEGIEAFDVPTKAAQRDINIAMSTSFGFGGHNAVMLLKRYEK